MKIRRTLPPAAAPLTFSDLVSGLGGLMTGRRSTARLENELRDYFGVKHVFLVSSGKAALATILGALKSLSPARKEVLIPAYTCYSVPSAVVKAGLNVALCDMDPERYDYDYRLFGEALSAETLCVLSGNLCGIPSDVARMLEHCKSRGIFVVEDAAQAMGGRYKDRLIGTIADVGFFSFGRGKNITCGSGGAIVTNSDALASAIGKHYRPLPRPGFWENVQELFLAAFLALFIRPALYWFPAGLPFLRLGETVFYRDFPVKRLSGMKAGLLRRWKQRLEEYNGTRRENRNYYCNDLQLTACGDFSDQTPMLRFPVTAVNREMRDRIVKRLTEQGLGAGRMYPASINMIEEIKSSFSGQEYPAARTLSERLFTVPTHPLLGKEERQTICEYLQGFSGSAAFISSPDTADFCGELERKTDVGLQELCKQESRLS